MSNVSSSAVQELQVHELSSSASDHQVETIMALSAQVFHSQPANPATHTSFTYWRDRLSQPRASIIYVARATEPDTPLGFYFNFPRTQVELQFEALHIWLAGVAEEARGLGIFPMLLERTVECARQYGYEFLTVNTMPVEFANMYRILRGNGWEVVAWQDSDVGQKVLLKLKL